MKFDAPTFAGRRTRRGRGRAVALGVGLVLLVGAAAAGSAAAWRPAWFRPAAVDHGQLRADKAALAAIQDGISAGLNGGERVTVRLTAAQLNRWLAARAEIWPEAAWLPVQEPCVELIPDGLRVGTVLEWRGWRVVGSARIAVQVRTDEIALRVVEAAVGALPVPTAWLVSGLAELPGVRDIGGRTVGAEVRLPNDLTWPNGRRRFRVAELRPGPDEWTVVLEPFVTRDP